MQGASSSLVRSFVFTCSLAAGLFVGEAHDEADKEEPAITIRQDMTGRHSKAAANQQEARWKRKDFPNSPPYLVDRVWCLGG
jgi:hypothetical protein